VRLRFGLLILLELVLCPLSFAAADSLVPVLPNSLVTPGATNPAVKQENINSTICLSGYTKSVRPSTSYITKLKVKQLSTLPYSNFNEFKSGGFEEDHLISLELGGSPSDPKNLWPEPYASSSGARVKDRLENALHALVCNGSIPLKTAQKEIATNWYAAYVKYVLRSG